ncbi:hypothetical protein B0H63DRAFT_467668 [Podospora didyma]|uniref:Mid2 domain-containing protein n=1 Tax=Podospora didyma TaxID=330526 RepID=A0AAE0U541_9PEZI|nr:hypothetical protein B0H63DRAFT_467668 [Podospora didyma]
MPMRNMFDLLRQQRPLFRLVVTFLLLFSGRAFSQTTRAAVFMPESCGTEGYFVCADADGGGCCPLGFSCGLRNCIPPSVTALSNFQTSITTLSTVISNNSECPGHKGYIPCPATVGGGCCPGNYICDERQPQTACLLTLKLSQTTFKTTQSNAATVTITSVIGEGITAVDRLIVPTGGQTSSLSPSVDDNPAARPSTYVEVHSRTPVPAAVMTYAQSFVTNSSPAVGGGGEGETTSSGKALTTGQIGGIASGVVSGVLLLLGAGIWLFWTRCQRLQIRGAKLDGGEDDDNHSLVYREKRGVVDVAELEGPAVEPTELPEENNHAQELPSYPTTGELDGETLYMGMGMRQVPQEYDNDNDVVSPITPTDKDSDLN